MKHSLLDDKKEMLLYYKSYDSAHWNMNDAFMEYQKIMETFRKDFPDLKIISKEDFNILLEKGFEAIAYLSAIKYLCEVFSFDDTLYKYQLKDKEFYGTDVKSLLQEINIETYKNMLYYHYVNKIILYAPKLLIDGDSYVYISLLLLLSKSFSGLYLIGDYQNKSSFLADL